MCGGVGEEGEETRKLTVIFLLRILIIILVIGGKRSFIFEK